MHNTLTRHAHQLEDLHLLLLPQAAQEQRASKGVVTTAVRGPTRPAPSSVSSSAACGAMFRAAIDEVERNHATQVGVLLAVCGWVEDGSTNHV